MKKRQVTKNQDNNLGTSLPGDDGSVERNGFFEQVNILLYTLFV